jgi:uncharacterized SAM-binding protein YcdF (DUF218 family)
MAATETVREAAPVSGVRRRRWWQVLLLVVVVPLFVWYSLDFTYEAVGAEDDFATHADVIIVLGCNTLSHNGTPISSCIGARSSHAADLYKEGLAPTIIATGGPTAGPDRPTESQVLQSVLESDGVPPSAIVQENRALDTIQNMAYSKQIMLEHGWHSAILVTEPFHIKRATLIAHDDGMTVYPSPALNSDNWDNLAVKGYNLGRDALSLMLYQWKVLAGDKT